MLRIYDTQPVSFFAYGICKNSFGPCALDPGPRTPVITNCALGNCSPNIAINVIVPPSLNEHAGSPKKFNDAEIFFPESEWAPKAALMAAYSYYSQNYYSDAIYEIDRYMEKYPRKINSSTPRLSSTATS